MQDYVDYVRQKQVNQVAYAELLNSKLGEMLLEKRKNKKKRPDVMSTELGISRTRGFLGDFGTLKEALKEALNPFGSHSVLVDPVEQLWKTFTKRFKTIKTIKTIKD